MDGHSDMGMMMYLHSSVHAIILFEGWETDNWGELLGSCIAVFLMATLTEALVAVRISVHAMLAPTAAAVDETTKLKSVEIPIDESDDTSIRDGHFSRRHLAQTALHTVQTFLRFTLMLVAMTFNIWILLAVVLGNGFGYFLFRKHYI